MCFVPRVPWNSEWEEGLLKTTWQNHKRSMSSWVTNCQAAWRCQKWLAAVSARSQIRSQYCFTKCCFLWMFGPQTSSRDVQSLCFGVFWKKLSQHKSLKRKWKRHAFWFLRQDNKFCSVQRPWRTHTSMENDAFLPAVSTSVGLGTILHAWFSLCVIYRQSVCEVSS